MADGRNGLPLPRREPGIDGRAVARLAQPVEEGREPARDRTSPWPWRACRCRPPPRPGRPPRPRRRSGSSHRRAGPSFAHRRASSSRGKVGRGRAPASACGNCAADRVRSATASGSQEPSMKRVRAGVLDVAYLEVGPPDGPPAVLLHGFPYDVHAYDGRRGAARGRRRALPDPVPARLRADAVPRSGDPALGRAGGARERPPGLPGRPRDRARRAGRLRLGRPGRLRGLGALAGPGPAGS